VIVTNARITVALAKGEDGEVAELRFYLNPEGRDLLVQELLLLDEKSDHLHLQPADWTVGLPLQSELYLPSEEELVDNVKVLLRPDHWDAEYFPHVMNARQDD
jgi:hypothetical protein